MTSAMTSGDSSKLQKLLTDGQKALSQIASIAPTQLKPAVQEVEKAETQLFTVLQKAGFNFQKVNMTQLESITSDPAFAQASKQLSTYFKTQCHITIGS